MYKLFLVLFMSIGLVACQQGETVSSTENPTVEEILSENADADIFLVDDLVYVNAEAIAWVNEMDLDLGEMIGEITKQSPEAEDFENFTASKLAVGTKVYATDEDVVGASVYLIEINGKVIPYLGQAEG